MFIFEIQENVFMLILQIMVLHDILCFAVQE